MGAAAARARAARDRARAQKAGTGCVPKLVRAQLQCCSSAAVVLVLPVLPVLLPPFSLRCGHLKEHWQLRCKELVLEGALSLLDVRQEAEPGHPRQRAKIVERLATTRRVREKKESTRRSGRNGEVAAHPSR